MPDKLQELWRCDYVKDAYTDQTGAKHWGNVVYERCVVVDTGMRFHVETGYNVSGEKTAGRIYIRAERVRRQGGGLRLVEGDEFRYSPELVDYSGGGSWRNMSEPVDDRKRGWWKSPPRNLAGYVHPDGTPVRRVLDA